MDEITNRSAWAKIYTARQGFLSLVLAFSAGMATLALFGSLLAAPADVDRNATELAELRGAQTQHVQSYGHAGTVELQSEVAEIKVMVYELWCDMKPDRCNLQPVP